MVNGSFILLLYFFFNSFASTTYTIELFWLKINNSYNEYWQMFMRITKIKDWNLILDQKLLGVSFIKVYVQACKIL